jgi:hypothetical protein
MDSGYENAAVNTTVSLYPADYQVEIDAQLRYGWNRGNEIAAVLVQVPDDGDDTVVAVAGTRDRLPALLASLSRAWRVMWVMGRREWCTLMRSFLFFQG